MNKFLTPRFAKVAYDSVDGEEEDLSPQHQPQSTYNSKVLSNIRQWSLIIICISVSSTVIIICILLLPPIQISHLRQLANENSIEWAHPQSNSTGSGSCGNSPSDAKFLGCSFDMFANAWIPAACYDGLVASNSESGTIYPVFWDSNHTRPATQEEVKLAAFANNENATTLKYFHTASEWHVAHCLHLWRLAASAAESLASGVKSVGIYSKAADLKHAMHCSKIIMGFGEKDGRDGAIAPVIGRCVGLDEMWDVSYGRL